VDLDLLAQWLAVPGIGELLDRVEARLDETLRVEASLAAAALRVTSGGGKRLRPALVMTTASIGGAERTDAALSAAAAVELVQVGSLIHDDVFESAATRRGVPTINSVEGDEEAVMAGDYVLARAASEAARSSQAVAQEVAATIVALCEGQLEEMRFAFDVDRPIESYLACIRGKTAALFECSCRCGAFAAGLPRDVVDALGAFGREFGMAFQILDDVLDVVANPERLGKPVGIDVATGVFTLPVLGALAGPHGDVLRALLRRRESGDVQGALAIVRDSPYIDEAIAAAGEYAAKAGDAVSMISGPQGEGLRTFAGRYVEWALRYFTEGASGRTAG